MAHGHAFAHGRYMIGEVRPMRDYDRTTRERAVQAVDLDTGLLVDRRCRRRRPGDPDRFVGCDSRPVLTASVLRSWCRHPRCRPQPAATLPGHGPGA
jgi:hypothetical protein